MKKIVQIIVAKMCDLLIIEADCIDAYEYTLQILLEQLITYIVIFIFAFIIGRVIEALSFILYFSMLRKHSGGFHMKSFISCFIFSIAIFVGYSVLIFPILLNHKSVNEIILLISFVFIIIVGALNNNEINWTREEFRKTKKIVRIIVTIECASIYYLDQLGCEDGIILYMSFGVMLCAFAFVLNMLQKKIEKTLASI